MAKDNTAEDQDTIDENAIAEMTDEELATAQTKDAEVDTDGEEESDDKGEEEDPEKDEKEEEEESDDKGEEEDPEKDEEEETPEETLKRELEEAKANNAKLQEQMDEKEKFAQLKANAEGDLRKELEAEREKHRPSKEERQELYDENPDAAVEARVEEVLADRKAKDAETNNARILKTETTKRTVEEAIPNFAEMIGEVAEIAKEAGASESNITAFKADPYGSSDAMYLISFGKRVLLERELKASREENKKLKIDPDDVAKKIEAAAKKKPAIKKNSSSREKAGDNLTRDDIANMSDEELAEMSKRLKGG